MSHGHLITPWLAAQGMAQCWHVPPCSRDTCSVVMGVKTFPRGSFPVGSQVPRHRGALGSIPAWRHGQALCLLSLVAVMEWLLPGMGMSPWDAVSRKQKGLAAPSTGDCAVEE